MSIEKQLLEDMKTAMKAGDKVRLETIRGLRAQLKNAQIEKGGELADDEVQQVLNNAAKKRKEAIEQYRALGRQERADMEARELEIIESYLPAQMTPEEIAAVVESTIARVKPESIKDLGKVMGALMPQLKGKADGKLVQQIVREKLAAL